MDTSPSITRPGDRAAKAQPKLLRDPRPDALAVFHNSRAIGELAISRQNRDSPFHSRIPVLLTQCFPDPEEWMSNAGKQENEACMQIAPSPSMAGRGSVMAFPDSTLPNPTDLIGFQHPPLAASQLGQGKLADRNAYQSQGRMANRRRHAPHLTVLSFAQGHLQP